MDMHLGGEGRQAGVQETGLRDTSLQQLLQPVTREVLPTQASSLPLCKEQGEAAGTCFLPVLLGFEQQSPSPQNKQQKPAP